MADDIEQQEDELLALASIYDERVFIQSSEEKGGQFNVFLELPKPFKLKIQPRYLPRSNKSRTHEGANGAQETGSVELLTVEYLPPIVLNFRFPENYPSKSHTQGDLTFLPLFMSNALPRGKMLMSNTPPWF